MNGRQQLAVVSGANRGLGFETCRQLARLGVKTILTSRDPANGQQARNTLSAEGLDVIYHPLDVTNPASIDQLATFVRTRFGQIDILVNNAGVFLDPHDPTNITVSSVFKASIDTLRKTLEINVYGPLMLCQAMVPLLSDEGRVVNVSSGMGQLSEMHGGCPGYRVSKAALNALTRILADELRDTGVKVNSVCPGWVRTDMGGPNAERTPEEGVATTIWLATLPEDGPSGGFFRDRAPIPW